MTSIIKTIAAEIPVKVEIEIDSEGGGTVTPDEIVIDDDDAQELVNDWIERNEAEYEQLVREAQYAEAQDRVLDERKMK